MTLISTISVMKNRNPHDLAIAIKSADNIGELFTRCGIVNRESAISAIATGNVSEWNRHAPEPFQIRRGYWSDSEAWGELVSLVD